MCVFFDLSFLPPTRAPPVFLSTPFLTGVASSFYVMDDVEPCVFDFFFFFFPAAPPPPSSRSSLFAIIPAERAPGSFLSPLEQDSGNVTFFTVWYTLLIGLQVNVSSPFSFASALRPRAKSLR